MVNNQNKLQYYLTINRQIPPTINGLDSFILKTTFTLTGGQIVYIGSGDSSMNFYGLEITVID